METERLILDSIRESDKEDYFTNISHDKRVLETYICRYADTLEAFDFSSYPGRQDLFAIRLKKTGRLIGIVNYFDEKDGVCEIGYGIGSGYWGHGYATEAVRRFLEYLFSEKSLHTVYASYFTGNEASRRVMEKCGMTFDHVSEKELTYLGVERDLTYYAIRRYLYPKTGCDLCVDSSETSPAALAEAILLAPKKDSGRAICSYRDERKMIMEHYITLRDRPELMDRAATWFHEKWGVPTEAYLKCMSAYLNRDTEYGWYLCLDGDRIVGGLGVIENDFHDRRDLTPNVCAVYTEEAYRGRGIAGRLLNMTVEDMRAKGISPLYLVTDHTGFYERYGWEFLCMVQGDGEPEMTRMYIHR